MPYSNVIWKYFNQPKNVGIVENPDAFGRAGSASGGNYMEFSARINDELITEIRFQTFGCAPAIAAGSLLTERLMNKKISEVCDWNVEKLIGELSGIPDEKRFCVELAIEAMRDLFKNFKNEHPNNKQI